MKQRANMIIATALTAFIVVILGGVAFWVSQSDGASAPTEIAATSDALTAPDALATPTLDPTMLALIQEREAAYQQAIEQANQQLQDAYQQQQTTDQSVAPIQNVAPASAPVVAPATTSQIDQEQAIRVAEAYVGGGTVVEVELENKRGLQVYAVKFADGSKVYVDAASAQVAYARLGGAREAGEHERDHSEYEHNNREREHND